MYFFIAQDTPHRAFIHQIIFYRGSLPLQIAIFTLHFLVILLTVASKRGT